MNLPAKNKALEFTILSQCKVSKARTSLMKLPNYTVELPMFMPVGTQGTLKGLTSEQVKDANSQIILGNTYHLGTRPGKDLIEQFGGLHKFMHWDRALLTDSGGFQMVSLLKLAEITEEGVKFQSPYDGSECMLTPEESIHIQNAIGADIIMQLDDVVNVQESNYDRFQEAVGRTTRWLDRCIKANKNPTKQNLFPIVQGGLFPDLRKRSLQELIKRDAPGYAIGGLSGGEDKNKFWPTVHLCTDHLPKEKPRYCMGVGFPVDLVVCCALGVDMFDCVYPTRTARFGCALVDGGQINLKSSEYKFDFTPIDEKCSCLTCKNYTKAYLKTIVTKQTIGCHLISIHNITYLMRLMGDIRQSIKEGRFPDFVREFVDLYFKDGSIPQWVVDALAAANIHLKEKSNNESKSDSDWESEENDCQYLDRMSGFTSTHFNKGYREAILEDNLAITAKGRILGFRSASEPQSLSAPSSCNDSTEIKSNNPTRLLSRWQGILSACKALRYNNLSHDNIEQVDSLLQKIDHLLNKLSQPPSEATEIVFQSLNVHDVDSSNKIDVDFSNKFDLRETSFVKYLQDSLACIDECKLFCLNVGWKIPQIN